MGERVIFLRLSLEGVQGLQGVQWVQVVVIRMVYWEVMLVAIP